ncbi:MAG TPA: hypothetical protein PKH07_01270 [bacterium]|nr:hypothetical protein [bacterium]
MITVNLLPHERRKARSPMMAQYLAIAGTAVVVGLVIMGTVYANMQLRNQEQRVETLTLRSAELDVELEEVRALENKKALLSSKERVIKILAGQRLNWAPKLFELASLVPNGVWLESMYIKGDRVKKTRKEEVPGSKDAQGKPKFRQKTYYVIQKRLVIEAITDDLTNKAALVGQFISNINKNASFSRDFSNLGGVEAREEHWVLNDDTSPLVWRFKISMDINTRGGAEEEIGPARGRG